MRKSTLPLLALAATFASGVAVAQTHSPNRHAFRTETPNQLTGALDEVNRRTMGQQRIVVTEKRYQRANRVAALINKGQCAQAYDLAINERDNKLASRVSEVCAAKGA